MSCLLCLTTTSPMIEIFSKLGKDIKICEIIAKHFWLKPNCNKSSEQNICKNCWRIVKEFHELYVRTAANTYYEEDVLSEQTIIKTSFDKTDTETLSNHNTENFPTLDEIKVEPEDFHILPKVEIIESTTTLSPEGSTSFDVKTSDDHFFDNTFDSDSNDSHDSFQDYFKDNVEDNNKTNYFKNAYTRKMCDLCGVILKHMDGLRHHMKTVHDTGEYKCEFCNRKSTNSIALYRHIKRNHKMDFGNNCPHCSQSFSSKRGLKLHLKTHTNSNAENETTLSIIA